MSYQGRGGAAAAFGGQGFGRPQVMEYICAGECSRNLLSCLRSMVCCRPLRVIAIASRGISTCRLYGVHARRGWAPLRDANRATLHEDCESGSRSPKDFDSPAKSLLSLMSECTKLIRLLVRQTALQPTRSNQGNQSVAASAVTASCTRSEQGGW